MTNLLEALVHNPKLLTPEFAKRLEPHYSNKNSCITGIDFITKHENIFVITSITDGHEIRTKRTDNLKEFTFKDMPFFETAIVIHTDIVTTNFRLSAASMSTIILKCAGTGFRVYRSYRRNKTNKFLRQLAKDKKI